MATGPEPQVYVVEHIRDALVQDPRIGELDLHVAIEGEVVIVMGHVSTVERQRAIDDVLAKLVPGHEVRNQTSVPASGDAPEEVV